MKLIDITFQLSLPIKWEYFRNLGSVSGQITKYKAWELEHTFYSDSLIDIDISYSVNQDHAGLNFVVGVLGYAVHFCIYDTRHWDYDRNEWIVYEF